MDVETSASTPPSIFLTV